MAKTQTASEPSIAFDSSHACPHVPSEPLREWFAAYTSVRHEKKVATILGMRDIESFLPLYRSLRLWKNGCKVNLEFPLFPNYIFVFISRRERVSVLEVPGVLSIVGPGNRPLALPQPEIEALRSGLDPTKCAPHAYLVVGEQARIKSGALAGLRGVLLRKKGAFRVVLSLNLIMKSVAVEVDAADVEPIGRSGASGVVQNCQILS